MSNISLYSQSGFGQVDRSLARRTDSALQTVEAKGAIAHSITQTRASLAATSMNNIGNLTALAEQIVKTSPAAAPYLEMTLRSYAYSAAQIISDFR